MRHKVKGLVIRETPKGETSKLLTILTSSMGVLTVHAKGVRKLSSPYLKSAQLFAFSDLLIYEKNGYYTLMEAAHITDFYPVCLDINDYALACYFCEVASCFCISKDESAIILRILLNSLYALENKKNTREILKSSFEFRICSECGFKPELSNCMDCDNELEGEDAFLFHVDEGVAFCRHCATQTNGCVLITRSVGKAIVHIIESDLSRFISFKIGEAEQKVLADISERFLLARAERGFKTLSFYKHCEELQ